MYDGGFILGTELFRVFNRPVTLFAALVCLSALLSGVLMLFLFKKERIPSEAGERFFLLSVVLGVFCGHLLYCLTRVMDLKDRGIGVFLDPSFGGFLFFGVFIGVFLAALLTRRIGKCPVSAFRLLSAALPAIFLAVALIRFAEPFDKQGWGEWVSSDDMPVQSFFPLAFIKDPEYATPDWTEWYYSIFMLEGLWALFCCVFFLLPRSRAKGDTYRLVLAMILYCAGQVAFEPMRRDTVVRWLFIRASQLFSASALAIIMIVYMLRRRRFTPLFLLLVLFAGGCVALEFAVDKPLILGERRIYFPNALVYALETCCAAMMGCVTWRGTVGTKSAR